MATEDKFLTFIGLGPIFQSWALGMQTKANSSISQICQSIDHLDKMGFKQFRPNALSLLAEVCLLNGQAEKGLKALEEAQVFMNNNDERYWEAEIYRLKGELLLSQSIENQSGAESCFQEALNVSRHQQTKSLELRATTSLSRLWQSQEKKEEARRLLSEIYGWFTEGFDTADLKDAKKLLEELSW
jgi:predicted ATPase